MNKLTLLLFAVLLSSIFGEIDSVTKNEKLTFSTELLGYCDNLEYFNEYRPGELILGSYFKSSFKYSFNERISAKAGIHLQRNIADSNALSLVRPLFQVQYHKGGFTCNIGDIHSPDRHGLPDAIISEESQFTNSYEEGLQFIYDFPAIYADLWLAYLSLNTPKHLEHLNLGLSINSPKRPLIAKAGLLWNHYGGQLHSVEGDYMRDSLHLYIAAFYKKDISEKGTALGGEIGALGSSVTKRRNSDPFHRGYGIYGNLFVDFFRFRCMLQLYKGEGYKASTGNKLYEVRRNPYCFFQIQREQDIAQKVSINWGVRLDFVEKSPKEFLEEVEYKAWVTITSGFSRNININKKK